MKLAISVLFLLCIAFIIGYIKCNKNEELTIEIPQGTIQGHHKTSYKGRKFLAFEGIPYAKPPVEERRFKEPEPSEKWDNVLIADKTYMCMSYLPLPMMKGAKGEEDCLYIYIYTPREKIDPNENLDVVVHIHGGAFMIGSPSMMAGPLYIMDKNVIYVSMNYRLGILGFLSTEDEVVPGNNGLKDQALALKWIKENIKFFGGNPESITLTGLSAGACSVHYHYLSPLSEGLFHRGFSQSGTALQSWALVEEPLNKAKAVAVHLECPTDSTKEMVQCLREKPVKDVVNAITNLLVFIDAIPFTPFGPVVENNKSVNPFLSEHPYKLMKEKKVYDVPWITSNVKEEGIFPAGFFLLLNKLKEIDKKWNKLMPYALDFNNTVDDSEKDEVSRKIRKFYFDDVPVTAENIYTLVQLFTDRTFLVDSEKAVRLHSKAVKSPVYYYFFTYKLEQIFIFHGMKKGVAHADDGRLMFPIIFAPKKLGNTDEAMMRKFMEFIANYAKTGVPQFNNIEWTPVNPDDQEIDYLHIASPEDISMKSMEEFAPNKFWSSLPIKENDKLFEKDEI